MEKALFNINDLTVDEMKNHLGRLDGITDEIALKIAKYADFKKKEGKLPFEDKKEFFNIAGEAGLSSAYMKGLYPVIAVTASRGEKEYNLYKKEVEFTYTQEKEYREDESFKVPGEEQGDFTFPVELDAPHLYGEEIPKDNRPLVFIPGVMGSSLKNHKGERVFPPISAHGIDLIKDLVREIKTKNTTAGEELTLHNYTTFVNRLRMIGYSVTAGNLMINPYDWTKSNGTNAILFARNIKAFLKHFNKRFNANYKNVDVIAHSMGGIITKAAILKSGAPVRKAVYTGTPHYGSPKAYFTLHPDIKTVDFKTELLFDVFKLLTDRDDVDDLDDTLADLAFHCTSVFELLPNDNYLKSVDMLRIDPDDSTTEFYTKDKSETYTKGEWMLPDNMHTKASVGTAFTESLGKTPPGNHLKIVCPNLKTLDEVRCDLDYWNSWDDPKASSRQGDETVPRYSACSGTEDKTVYITGTVHAALLEDMRTFKTIVRYLGLKKN